MTVLIFALMISNIVLGSLTSLLSAKVQGIKIDSFKSLVENDYSILFRRNSVFSEELDNPGKNSYMSQVKIKTKKFLKQKSGT